MNKMRNIVSLLLCACLHLHAFAENISLASQAGGFALVTEQQKTATIVVDSHDAEVVQTVADCVAGDIELVTNCRPAIVNALSAAHGMAVIAGTVGASDMIDQLAAAGKIDVADVSGKWEAYALQIVNTPAAGIDKALVVYGSTPRGTAYGLFEISRIIGVSPLVWWADVVPENRRALYLDGDKTVMGEPSVKFRGIFINDEDWGITPWAAAGLDKQYNNIGPGAYAKVMEMLLRMRANILWPAMHACSQAFWDNKDNLPVARKYDIMLGSSHCEQMLRDNEWEWRRYEGNSGTNENWNYVTNKEQVQRYWEERVVESKGIDAMYTLGMRGVHDWGIGGYPTTADKVRGLTEIIDFQRSLISKHINADPTAVPQVFIPYKEVLDAYNAGLQVPEDVTLCWVDDNFGYVRQMPKPAEQARSGGNGMYYHLSYWGVPADYLWLCTTPPALISYELTKSYENGVKTLWVINVGDIKPGEAETEFCMDLAWDVNSWKPENAHKYMRQWAARTFGEYYADRIAAIKEAFYRLAAAGKPEHVLYVGYSNAEKDRRISEYAAIVAMTDELKATIPSRLQDAFFELIEYPVKCSYYMNVKTFRAAQSLEAAAAGKRDKALSYADEAKAAFANIVLMTTTYNKTLADGKWYKMMDYKPVGNNGPQFNMPRVAIVSDISPIERDEDVEPDVVVVPASEYIHASAGFTTIEGLGIGQSAVTVWPLDMTAHSASDAPYLEYDVPVRTGVNKISARFLPTFSVNTNYDLRVAISVDGAAPQVMSLRSGAESGKWYTNVLVGYNDATVSYKATADKNIRVRISMLDPGVVLCDIKNQLPEVYDLTLTEQLIVNYDFEIRRDGTENTTGATDRGIPYGWQSYGKLLNNQYGQQSYGINNDANNLHGMNVCWMNSSPMPETFELYQTIAAGKIEAGWYKISCLLGVEAGKETSCRLFANNSVQYYGKQSAYTNLLTDGETAAYAGHTSDGIANLKPMEVYVKVGVGEDLKLGIRTGNKKNDGTTATDNAGWFKVDFFRIEKANYLDSPYHGEAPQADKAYYLYNVQTGQWLNYGYGVSDQQLGVDANGMTFKLEYFNHADASRGYAIKTIDVADNTYYGWREWDGVENGYYGNSKKPERFDLLPADFVENGYKIELNYLWGDESPNHRHLAAVGNKNNPLTVTYKQGSDIWQFVTPEEKAEKNKTVVFDPETEGYLTLCLPYQSVIPAGVIAYKASAPSQEGVVTLTAIDGNQLPAKEAVLLKATAGETYAFPADNHAAMANFADNYFRGNSSSEPVTVSSLGHLYVLTLGHSIESHKMGFYRYTGSDIAANKVYYPVDVASQDCLARGFAIECDNDATAIPIVKGKTTDGKYIYDLQGRRVSRMRQKGIYMVNGNKVLIL